MTKQPGNLRWMAPEVFTQCTKYSGKVGEVRLGHVYKLFRLMSSPSVSVFGSFLLVNFPSPISNQQQLLQTWPSGGMCLLLGGCTQLMQLECGQKTQLECRQARPPLHHLGLPEEVFKHFRELRLLRCLDNDYAVLDGCSTVCGWIRMDCFKHNIKN